MFSKRPTSNNNESVLVFKYSVRISSQYHDFIHGGHTITECYIPSLKICFNQVGDSLNVFKSDAPRNDDREIGREDSVPTPITKIYLPRAFINRISKIANLAEEIKKEEKPLLADPTLQNALDQHHYRSHVAPDAKQQESNLRTIEEKAAPEATPSACSPCVVL